MHHYSTDFNNQPTTIIDRFHSSLLNSLIGANGIAVPGTDNSTDKKLLTSEESDRGHVTNVYVTGGATGPRGERGLRGEPGLQGIRIKSITMFQ